MLFTLLFIFESIVFKKNNESLPINFMLKLVTANFFLSLCMCFMLEVHDNKVSISHLIFLLCIKTIFPNLM